MRRALNSLRRLHPRLLNVRRLPHLTVIIGHIFNDNLIVMAPLSRRHRAISANRRIILTGRHFVNVTAAVGTPPTNLRAGVLLALLKVLQLGNALIDHVAVDYVREVLLTE